ncbi:hypothetical protein [Demequina pelophila]|uniref:hypothetical protein n=1 Tax=Demequina pelophila TaxID=1638984 RepID=UPI00078413F0|nr:hypothetical protein [Demequina pelophila]
MNGREKGTGAGARRRGVLVAAMACVAPLVAACDSGTAGDEAAADSAPTAAADSASASSPEPTEDAAAGATGTAPADDPDLWDRLEAFDDVVEIEGFAVPSRFRSPVDRADGWYGSSTPAVEPADCVGFMRAEGLGTTADLTSAAGDLINPVSPFFPGGKLPGEDEAVPSVSVFTRVFGDEALAGEVTPLLLDADCTTYTTMETWDDGTFTSQVVVDEVTAVDLEGLSEPAVRIAYGASSASLHEEATGETQEWAGPPSVAYVYVDGPYGITVGVEGVDGAEAIAASVIGRFLDHMAAE